MYTACHIINIWTKKTKRNKRNWHIACCAANKASLSTTLQSCELFIPAPAQFSGTSGSCTQFLHQCFLVFDQQWQMSATDTSKTIFMSDLLTEKVACLGSRSFTMEPHQSATPIVFFFTSEMTKVFDGPLQPGVNYSPSVKGQGQPRITVSTSAFWPLSAVGPNPHSMRFFGMDYVRNWTTTWHCTANPAGLEELIILTVCLDNSLEEKRRKRMASGWWASLTARSPLGARQRGLREPWFGCWWQNINSVSISSSHWGGYAVWALWRRVSIWVSAFGNHLNSCSDQPKSSNPVVNRGMLVSWDRESSPCVQLLGILSFFQSSVSLTFISGFSGRG